MISNKLQHLLVTAIPRGYADNGDLRVGVRITIRLAYSSDPGEAATLGDFPDFADWPIGGFAWEATFNNGATWEAASDEIWNADQGFWAATFHRDLRVDSKPIRPPTVRRSVVGYRHAPLAEALPGFHTTDLIDASPLGQELLGYVFPGSEPPPGSLTEPVARFMDFYRRTDHRDRVAPFPATRLDPDFHQRIALLADHGPALERLGLALELRFPPRARAITKLAVRVSPKPAGTTVGSPYTRVANTPGSIFSATALSSDLDNRLRLRLDDSTRFGVHSIDVDASLISAFSTPPFEAGNPAPPPPAPRSTGITITQDDLAAVMRDRLAAGRSARDALKNGASPTVSADGMIQGYHVEALREDGPRPQWLSLCHRAVTYTAYAADGSERSFTAMSEAPVVAGLRMRDADDDLETSDVLARWDGWSLAVERPGRYQLQADALTGDVVDSAGAFPGGTLDMAAALPTGAAYQLPVLRFGSSYRFRARAVDVTGFAHPWDGAPESASTPYYRYDPVSTPLVLSPSDPTRTETSLRLVVRSAPGAPSTETSSRTVVPARAAVETGLTHRLFDKDGAPDPDVWSQIAELDEKVPPRQAPPPLDDAGTPAPVGVDWLPDPMSTSLGVELLPRSVNALRPMREVSFLPPGADDWGRDDLGAWWAVAIRLHGTSSGSPIVGAVQEGDRIRILPVSLPPGYVRTMVIRGLPPRSRLSEHGLFHWFPPLLGDAEDRIFDFGWERMCPTTRLTLVHAVRRPLTSPSLAPRTAVSVERGRSQKDARMAADVAHHAMSTGRLTVFASWSEWRDEGGFVRTSRRHAPPQRVEIMANAVAEAATAAEPGTGARVQRVEGTLVAPDLRRIDVKLTVRATSRFVEEFREPLAVTWTDLPGIDGAVLDLPADVDVESVRLLRDGRDLVRSTDYREITDPRDDRRTLAVYGLAGARAGVTITVLGVKGSILTSGTLGTVVVPAAMRPLPPSVAYVVPAFAGQAGKVEPLTGRSVATRDKPRLRIWLERPWWSSGDQEKLAVVWEMAPEPPPGDDDRISKLVTLFGTDPLYRAFPDDDWMVEPLSGLALPSPITLDEGISPLDPVTVKVRLHDVTYDAARDMYYAEVVWPDHVGGKFVRPAIARFQQHVTAGNSQLSLIRTIDPVRLLQSRRAEAFNVTASQFNVTVTGTTGLEEVPDNPAEYGRLRVSLQLRTALGDPELGWDTVASKDVVFNPANGKFPSVGLSRPTASGTYRILVEELEAWTARDAAGGVATNSYSPVPQTAQAAVADLTGRRPVWVATLPLPANVP